MTEMATEESSMAPRRSLGVIGSIGIMAMVVVLDQITKVMAMKSLAQSDVHTYLGGLFTLLYAENSGAFLSLGSGLPPRVREIIFSVLVGIALAIAFVTLLRGRIEARRDAIAVAFIIGGGIGNLIDRVVRDGHVVDFLYLSAGPLHTGVFNVADLAITGGVCWLAYSWIRPQKPPAATTP